MKAQHVLVVIAVISLAACSASRHSIQLSVDLPSGTNAQNSVASAQVALNKAATKLCGKSMEVPVESIIVTTDAGKSPLSYKATSMVACEMHS
jgi:hypothetical protein